MLFMIMANPQYKNIGWSPLGIFFKYFNFIYYNYFSNIIFCQLVDNI